MKNSQKLTSQPCSGSYWDYPNETLADSTSLHGESSRVREFNLEWPAAQRTAKAGMRRQLLAGPKGTGSHHSSTVTGVGGGKVPTSRPLTE